jgi:hypothetical protein
MEGHTASRGIRRWMAKKEKKKKEGAREMYVYTVI